ncbi:uncharacterized protein [Aquarana catesbeiana]|uniref:uncharacterized protein n=1 Tax=Aquarana catesbeiana TaxID=8400 RepID=UPI003CCA3F77
MDLCADVDGLRDGLMERELKGRAVSKISLGYFSPVEENCLTLSSGNNLMTFYFLQTESTINCCGEILISKITTDFNPRKIFIGKNKNGFSVDTGSTLHHCCISTIVAGFIPEDQIISKDKNRFWVEAGSTKYSCGRHIFCELCAAFNPHHIIISKDKNRSWVEAGSTKHSCGRHIFCELCAAFNPHHIIIGNNKNGFWVEEPTHPFKVGDTVVVQQLNRSKKREYPFGPPTTVVAVTRTAVLVENCQSWIHASRVKKVVQRPGSKKEILDTGGPQAEVQADEGGVPGKAGPAREDDLAYFTTDSWQGILSPDPDFPDSVSAHMDHLLCPVHTVRLSDGICAIGACCRKFRPCVGSTGLFPSDFPTYKV